MKERPFFRFDISSDISSDINGISTGFTMGIISVFVRCMSCLGSMRHVSFKPRNQGDQKSCPAALLAH